jgi:REP element-mobilizing transposase RayT
MPRTRRHIQPGRPYELILRVKEGFPFCPSPLINTLLNGIIARAQRDNKVTLCHYRQMSNLIHIILIAKCPVATVNFYQKIREVLLS